jgi:hypothetical protein
MAKKRRVESKDQEPQLEEELGSDLPLWMQEQSWSDWMKKVFASRFYALACFAFDVFFGLGLANALGSEISWVVLPVIAFFVALQVAIYLYLWGSEGKLR